MSPIVLAAVILGGVGITFAGLIALTNRFFHVEEDPRVDAITGMLPGSNCGACGHAGCRAFAEALINGTIPPAGCTVMGEDDIASVAEYLGVDVGEAHRRVARLLCGGTCEVAPARAEYRGLGTCVASATVAAGGKACVWGCLGLGDCERVCDFDALVMRPDGLPQVIPALCTACGDCVEICPKDLFALIPVEQKLLVQCRNPLDGARAEAVCAVACNACGKCAVDAPGLITMRDGLPVIDVAALALQGRTAVARCPTGAIVWVDGAQFGAPGVQREREVVVA